MVKIQIILIIIISCTTMACSQNQKLGPGYQFDLFKKTANWDLAQAVDREDTIAIKQLIIKNKLNVDLQEPEFGRTLLLLAVGNDKLISTKILLEVGANLKIADLQKYKPIHEASKFISLKKNTLQILELLIKHEADVNDTLVQRKGNDTSYFYVPLMGVCENLICTKLLLEHGANPYIKQGSAYFGDTYIVWNEILVNDLDENIYVAKYMIVDKKMSIPEFIVYNIPKKKPADIFYFLDRENFKGDEKKEKARQEILDYLKQINFPKNGVYKEKE